MISQHPVGQPEPSEAAHAEAPVRVILARYGAVPQVARFGLSDAVVRSVGDRLVRGAAVVVQTDRGPEIAQVLEVISDGVLPEQKPVTGDVLRMASPADQEAHDDHRAAAQNAFFDWEQRLRDWQLQLQLIDIEWTLDREQIILYVLNGQNAETTRLALLAAAAGLGIIHVQPVAADGIVQSSGGGCGSGCGCG